VVVGIASVDDEHDVILESVGGTSLTHALRLVARHGTIVTFGNSARGNATLIVSAFYPRQAALRGYYFLDDVDEHPIGDDLAMLATLVACGGLHVEIGLTADWTHATEVLKQLRERRIRGKAVLRVGASAGATRRPTARAGLDLRNRS
jgi:NADPH:quinone reductase-like Zn-dependent oxidoreductase